MALAKHLDKTFMKRKLPNYISIVNILYFTDRQNFLRYKKLEPDGRD